MPIWLGLKLLGWWNSIKSAIIAHPGAIALGTSALLNVWLWHEVHTADGRIADMKKASAQNHIAQIAVNQQPHIVSQVIAEKDDASSPAYYAAVARAGRDWAVAHPVRVCNADGRAPGLPGADRSAPEFHGPGDTSDMVAVPSADYALLVANSGRLAQVHAATEELIAAGVFVADTSPEPEP